MLSPEVKVTQATTVEQAIRLLNCNKQPDLILLDLFMYPDSGFYFLKQYSFMQVPHASVVVVSASFNKSDKDRANQHLLVKGYLEKPLTRDSLHILLKGWSLKPPIVIKKDAFKTSKSGQQPDILKINQNLLR